MNAEYAAGTAGSWASVWRVSEVCSEAGSGVCSLTVAA
jgi:hypothetical protein